MFSLRVGVGWDGPSRLPFAGRDGRWGWRFIDANAHVGIVLVDPVSQCSLIPRLIRWPFVGPSSDEA
jgi:hypothetical protein